MPSALSFTLGERGIMNEKEGAVPSSAQSAVLMRSEPLPSEAVEAIGPQFEKQDPNDLNALMGSLATVGFQGTSVAEAVRIIERMVRTVTYSQVAYMAFERRPLVQPS